MTVALAYVFKKSDPGGSANILGLLVDALFYADDAALLSSTAEEAAERMDAIAKALRELTGFLQTGQDTGKIKTFRELRRGSERDGQLGTIVTLSEL